MSDPITFDPLGTITVEFDGETYTLTRPKTGQWIYFKRLIEERRRENQTILDRFKSEAARIDDKIKTAKTKAVKEKAEAEGEVLAAEWSEFASTPAWEQTIPWMKEAFNGEVPRRSGGVYPPLSDKPLPEDVDDWPAWLAVDSSLPTAILAHWQSRPKASGVEEQ